MTRMLKPLAVVVLMVSGLGITPLPGDDADQTALPAAQLDPEAVAFFETNIRPVLIEHCYRCHSADAKRVRGDFMVDTREAILRGGPSGHAIVPGDPDASTLIQAIRYDDEDFQMPPEERLPDDVIRNFETWVAMGAPDPRVPRDGTGPALPVAMDIEAGREFWAFKKPIAPEVPTVANVSWPYDDLDRFILAELENRQLKPVRDAEREVLIRRLTFDLIGLPPTPKEIDAFVRGPSTKAVEKLVDRLLASPRFGERWGRHWLDVARYAESSGRESNILYPHAWRYRDYVIDAFNKDKPYDRFLKEQIAGDLMPAASDTERAQMMIATGFLAIGTKSHNTGNRRQFAMDLADEQIDALSQGMLGLTVACARCHDHKFDPIPTRDYYAMAGIFLSTETCYGTVEGNGNRRESPLLELPGNAQVALGTPMPLALHTTLKRQLFRSEKERDELAEAAKGMDRRNNPDAAKLRRARSRVETIGALLARFDESGQPNGSSLVSMGAREAEQTRNARLLVRGELEQAADAVPRGFPQVISDDATPTILRGYSGRRELADWVASADNPLTARVWVNRVWLHLFGRGIVPTPDNFGNSGNPPTHPALLDHLAVTFIEDGWSTKQLIRRIVLSHAYRLGAAHHIRNYEIDPDNTFVWRMDRRRLEAEAIRDAMLFAAGVLQLEPPTGSPIAVTEGSARALNRIRRTIEFEPPVRSVYLPIVRDQLVESLDVFDFAEPSFVIGAREKTNVPSQALYLLNSELVMSMAEAMARNLLAQDATDGERLRRAFMITLGREPSGAESAAVQRFFEDFPIAQGSGVQPPDRKSRNSRRRGRRPRDGSGSASDADNARLTGWSAFCQSLFCSAEFRYIN